MSKGKFALGAIIGAVAGVIAGVLTAPKSGKATRADLRERAAELKDDTSRKARAIKRTAGHVVEDTQEKMQEYRDASKKAAKDVKNNFDTRK